MSAAGLQQDFDVVELVPWTPPVDAAIGVALPEVAYRKNAWTPADDARLREHFFAETAMPLLAWMLDRTENAVRTRVRDLGLRRRVSLPWSDLEDEELGRRYGADSAADIASDLGRSVSSVYVRAQLLGLSETNPPPWSGWEDAQLAAAYAQDVPAAAVSELVGRPIGGVVSRAHKLGLRRPSTPEGWSPEEVARALTLAHEGKPYREIAKILSDEGFAPRVPRALGQHLRLHGYHRGWGRRWTPEEDEALRAAYQDGASLTPLMERLDRTRYAIRHRVKEIGLQGTHPNMRGWVTAADWSPDEEKRLRRDYGRVATKEIAGALGRPLSAVYCRANALGLVHGYHRPWSDQEATIIAVAWRTGVSITHLARLFRRDPTPVSNYATRLGYRFSDPNRPARAARGPIKGRRQPDLDELRAQATPAEQKLRAIPLKPRGAAAPTHRQYRKAA